MTQTNRPRRSNGGAVQTALADRAALMNGPFTLPGEAGDVAAARERIQAARTVLLVTHISPDGDAIGSLCGMGLALRAVGKTVTLVCDDTIPEVYRFIPASGEILQAVPEGAAFDLFVVLDCADMGRAGQAGQTAGRPPDLNFDHHVTNPDFAAVNFVDPAAAATAELLFQLFGPLGLPLELKVAECLLAALVADTIGFRTSSVTQRTLATAQGLMAAGASLPRIYDLTLNRRSFIAARLWGEGLTRMHLEDGIVWATLPLAAKETIGYRGQGDADLINVLTTVNEARVSVVFVERPDGKVKISLRAHVGLDVASVASAFGGGGHEAAAGAEIEGSLEEVQVRVLAAVREMLKARAQAA